MSKYVDSKIWLRVPGGVEGWDLDELNARIDEFNRIPSGFRSSVSFWDWLSYHEGRDLYGLSGLWWSKLTSQLHIIKGGE